MRERCEEFDDAHCSSCRASHLIAPRDDRDVILFIHLLPHIICSKDIDKYVITERGLEKRYSEESSRRKR